MRKEAEKFAAEDEQRKEEAEVMNQADTLVYTADNLFKDIQGKVDESKLEPVKKEVEELKKLMESKDVPAVKEKLESVQKQIQALSVEMYQKVAAEQAAAADKKSKVDGKDGKGDDATGGAGPGAGDGDKEKVVDAEYEDVTDEKKKK